MSTRLRDRAPELVVIGLFAIVVAVAMARHELWRDEVQAWLIAAASRSPIDIVRNTRYEGHPFLWYLVLWPFTKVSRSLRLEQLVQWCVAVATTAIVVLRAPFGRLPRFFLPFGYFTVFEYGVLTRSYALGILLLVGALAVRRWSVIAVLLAAAMFTSAYTAIVALAILAGLLADEWQRHPEHRRNVVGGAVAGVAVALLAYVQARPAAGTSALAGWHTSLDAHRGSAAMASVVRALAPVPKIQHDFWNTNITDGHSGIAAVLSIIVFIGLAWLLRDSVAACTTWIVGSVGVVAFSYLKIDDLASARYLGHVFIVFVAALWLHERDRPRGRSALMTVFTVVLVVHVAVGAYALTRDASDRFSDAEAAAAFIEQPRFRSARVIVEPDFTGAPLAAYLDRPVYYPQGRRAGTYTKWDARRVEGVEALTASARPGDLVVTSAPAPGARLRLLAHFTDGIVPDEQYWIYQYQ